MRKNERQEKSKNNHKEGGRGGGQKQREKGVKGEGGHGGQAGCQVRECATDVPPPPRGNVLSGQERPSLTHTHLHAYAPPTLI